MAASRIRWWRGNLAKWESGESNGLLLTLMRREKVGTENLNWDSRHRPNRPPGLMWCCHAERIRPESQKSWNRVRTYAHSPLINFHSFLNNQNRFNRLRSNGRSVRERIYTLRAHDHDNCDNKAVFVALMALLWSHWGRMKHDRCWSTNFTSYESVDKSGSIGYSRKRKLVVFS